MFTDINIYSIMTKQVIFRRNIFFLEKKIDIFPISGRIWSMQDPDPDPYQNETEPKH